MKYLDSRNADKILEQYEYTYDAESNILTEHTKFMYENNLKDEEKWHTYDKKGNQIKVVDGRSNTVTENTYDVQNQLTDVTVTEDGEVISTQKNEYNGAGQRISKTDNGVKTYYFYEGTLLLYTTDESGKKTSQNIIGNQSNVIASIRYNNGQHAFFYSKDIPGSTSVITDENCDYVVSYEYTDYGVTTKQGNTDFYNEICYTGSVYDELTGLYYLNARYYNPKNGGFLS